MSMNLYKVYETDEKLEKEGFWYSFSGETKFLLARAGGSNMKFAKKLEANTRPHRRQIDNDTVDEKLALELMADAFVGNVLLDWKGVLDTTGAHEQEFSRENAMKLLCDLPDLFLELRTEAQRLSNFLKKQTEEDAGN